MAAKGQLLLEVRLFSYLCFWGSSLEQGGLDESVSELLPFHFVSPPNSLSNQKISMCRQIW